MINLLKLHQSCFFRHQASSAAAPAVPRIRSMPPARSDADWTSGLHWAAPGANDLEGCGWSHQLMNWCAKTSKLLGLKCHVFLDGHVACLFQRWTLPTCNRTHTDLVAFTWTLTFPDASECRNATGVAPTKGKAWCTALEPGNLNQTKWPYRFSTQICVNPQVWEYRFKTT